MGYDDRCLVGLVLVSNVKMMHGLSDKRGMKNTSSSASNSADAAHKTTASGNVAADSLEIRDDSFWVKLTPDRLNPAKFVGVDWDGKACLFGKTFAFPASWKVGLFVMVVETLVKPAFRCVTLPRYHSTESIQDFAIAKMFTGVLDTPFETDSTNAVVAWLDARMGDILRSPELEAAVAANQKRLEQQLADMENEARLTSEREAFLKALASRLSSAGASWLMMWSRFDRTFEDSDDHRAVVSGQKKLGLLQSIYTGLLKSDKDVLCGGLFGSKFPLPLGW